MDVREFLLNFLVKMKILTLKKRKDFIKAAQGFKVVVNGLVLQAAFSSSEQQKECCFLGYTATKKLGKAYFRNRTKRRLRAAAALVFSKDALCGVNYVLIGRHNTESLDFTYLVRRMKEALAEINTQILAQGNSDDQKNNVMAN